MPRLRSENFIGKGDVRWIGDTHALDHAFTATTTAKKADYPLGYVPSGTPVVKTGNAFSLPATATTKGVIGFLAQDQPLGISDAEPLNIPVMDRGRVLTSFLPTAHQGITAAALTAGVAITFLTA